MSQVGSLVFFDQSFVLVALDGDQLGKRMEVESVQVRNRYIIRGTATERATISAFFASFQVTSARRIW